METYYDKLDEIKQLVAKYFTVEDVFYEAGLLTFLISDREIKEKFKALYMDLRKLGFAPTAKREDGKIVIRIFRYQEPAPSISRFRNLPLYLFIATLVIVAVDGYLRASSPIYDLLSARSTLADKIVESALFTASLMMIIGLHELGHMIAAKKSGMKASPPYFIPGIPTYLPTFGAVIFQKGPIVNRDDMFDIGFSGPVTSFLMSIAVAALAFYRAIWFPEAKYLSIVKQIQEMGGGFLPSPLLFNLLYFVLGKPGMLPIFTTIGFAAWLGLLVTALNLFPIWQLDGGRIFRSVLTAKQHKIASYISLAVLALTGYFFFALLLLLLMPRAPDIPPLDQVSPLSRSRKLAFISIFIIIVLSFVPAFYF